MKKRGMSTLTVTIAAVLVIVVLFIIGGKLFAYSERTSSKSFCKIQIEASSARVGAGTRASSLDQCTTRLITITPEKSVMRLEGDDRSKEADLASVEAYGKKTGLSGELLIKDFFYKTIADEAVQCWGLFDKGTKTPFEPNTVTKRNTCLPCAKVELNDDARKMIKTPFSDFRAWLATNTIDNPLANPLAPKEKYDTHLAAQPPAIKRNPLMFSSVGTDGKLKADGALLNDHAYVVVFMQTTDSWVNNVGGFILGTATENIPALAIVPADGHYLLECE